MYDEIVDFIRSLYPNQNPVGLHSPVFQGKEKEYLEDCIDSTFVSYVGEYVSRFERAITEFTGAKYAVAMVNGTTALQIALQLQGVGIDDEVITQPLTFVATANAIKHCGGDPVFIDIDSDTLGLSPEMLKKFLNETCQRVGNICINKSTQKRISAIVPVHVFGHPCKIDEIVEVANEYHLPVIEDAAESLGSFYHGKHTGTYGQMGVLSFNGNKIITTGGGGMIITDDEEMAMKAKHITTTGKIPHQWDYIHDVVAYNFRLPNVNAAIGYAQMESIHSILENKRKTAESYREFFEEKDIHFFEEPRYAESNFWLNTIVFKEKALRDEFLKYSNEKQIVTRPAWVLLNKLDMYKNCHADNIDNAIWFEEKAVNLPSSYRQ